MRRHSTPDSQGRLSEKRKQEMLELLYDEMDSLHGRKPGKITKLLGHVWRGVAVIFILLCIAWLLIPGKLIIRRDSNANRDSSAASVLNIQEDIPEREKLDMELYEMDRRMEEALSAMADLIDRDLTGF